MKYRTLRFILSLFDKIFGYFMAAVGIYKKFTFICRNIEEWNNIQIYLFNKGFKWERNEKEILNMNWKFPRLIKNYRKKDIIGKNYLIVDSFYPNDEKYNIIEVSKFLRKEKLKKLK